MDNLHAAQMELNQTIEETHHLQSSQSALLQVLESEFEHFITDHWRPMQAVVQHSRIHLPCTCPLHLAAQRPSPSPSSSSCPLPQRCPDSESGSGLNGIVTAQEDGSGHPSSIPPLISHSPSISNSPSSEGDQSSFAHTRRSQHCCLSNPRRMMRMKAIQEVKRTIVCRGLAFAAQKHYHQCLEYGWDLEHDMLGCSVC